MKKIITCLLLCSISSLFSQKITFNIENDTIGSTFSIRKVTNEVVRNVTLKELNFDLDGISLDEGYYILKKEEDKAVLYIKPAHELTISFDAEDFHNSIEFTGKGALINKFLAEKNATYKKKPRIRHYFLTEKNVKYVILPEKNARIFT